MNSNNTSDVKPEHNSATTSLKRHHPTQHWHQYTQWPPEHNSATTSLKRHHPTQHWHQYTQWPPESISSTNQSHSGNQKDTVNNNESQCWLHTCFLYSSAFTAPRTSTSSSNGTGFVGVWTRFRGRTGVKSLIGFALNSLAWNILITHILHEFYRLDKRIFDFVLPENKNCIFSADKLNKKQK